MEYILDEQEINIKKEIDKFFYNLEFDFSEYQTTTSRKIKEFLLVFSMISIEIILVILLIIMLRIYY